MTTVTRIIIKVCRDLDIDCKVIDENGVFLELCFKSKKLHLVNTNLGLSSLTDGRIALDKWYQYLLLYKKIRMPKTKMYLDPESIYRELAEFRTKEELLKDIIDNFEMPMIVKRNRGSLGVHVFKVEKLPELERAVDKIFNMKNKDYDYGLIVQNYIETKKEYRVVMYKWEIMLAYFKDTNEAKFVGNLSPLHWEGSKAKLTSKKEFLKLEEFCRNLFEIWPIKYAGLDIIEDKNRKLFLIEMNSAPGLSHFIDDNGETKVEQMYKKILMDWKRE